MKLKTIPDERCESQIKDDYSIVDGILEHQKYAIPYYKRFRYFCKTIPSTILFQQLLYWIKKYPKGFYKPIHEGEYNWCDELEMSKNEFWTAFKNIGVRHSSKKSYDEAKNPFMKENKSSIKDYNRCKEGKFIDNKNNIITIKSEEEMMFCYYYDRINHKTFFFANLKKIIENLNEMKKYYIKIEKASP
ncbi:MAG: hypothetical protein ACFE95_09840 [Candidatus Hodarchaeota archaeon]